MSGCRFPYGHTKICAESGNPFLRNEISGRTIGLRSENSPGYRNASCIIRPKSTPGIERPEPLITPSVRVATHDGKLYLSFNRPAIIPITPPCQLSPQTNKLHRPASQHFCAISPADNIIAF